MREGHLRRRHGQPSERRREQRRILVGEATFSAWSERRGPEAEEPLSLECEPFAHPRGGLLHASVLGEAARELLGGLLGLQLGELCALLGEELACLDLEQRRDEHEELAAGVEVDVFAQRFLALQGRR